MATAKKTRAPIKRSGDNTLADLAGLQLPTAAPEPAEEPTPAPAEKVEPVPALAEQRPEKPAPAVARKPSAKPKKPKGSDPYKGKAKIDAYATPEVVAAIKYLAADDDRSQGYIVRKYLDIDAMLADAKAAGFEVGEG